MSDLKPSGIKVDIGGVEHEFLFTIEAIEAIQENCNAPLMDVIGDISRVADGGTDTQDLKAFCTVIAALCQKEGTKCTAKDIDGVLKPVQFPVVAWKILEAYGFSMPDPDSEDEDSEEDEEEVTNQKTGL